MNRVLLEAAAVVERAERYSALLDTIVNTSLDEQVRWNAQRQAEQICIEREKDESKGLDS